MAVLVTGVAGFIGSHLAEALSTRGDRVVGIDTLSDSADYPAADKRANLAAVEGRVAFSVTDIRDLDAVRDLMRREAVDRVIHLAARSGVRLSVGAPLEYASVNVAGTAAMLQAAHEVGAHTFINASSSSVYGVHDEMPFAETDPADQPVSLYAATKRAGELLCHAAHQCHGLSTTCLRMFTVYGPRQRRNMAIHRFVGQLERGEPVTVFGNGNSARDYTYVADAVAGILAALDRAAGFEVVNLGSSRPVRLNALVELLERVTGQSAEIDRQPRPAADVPYTCADISRAKQLLDWSPQTSLERGLAQFIEWYRNAR